MFSAIKAKLESIDLGKVYAHVVQASHKLEDAGKKVKDTAEKALAFLDEKVQTAKKPVATVPSDAQASDIEEVANYARKTVEKTRRAFGAPLPSRFSPAGEAGHMNYFTTTLIPRRAIRVQ